MKMLLGIAAVALLSGCSSIVIPDNIPPAPPARKGEPILAPSSAADEPVQDGFGGEDGFGGDTPTITVVEQPAAPEAAPKPGDKKPGDKKDGDKKAADPKPDAKDGADAEAPADDPKAAEPEAAPKAAAPK